MQMKICVLSIFFYIFFLINEQEHKCDIWGFS